VSVIGRPFSDRVRKHILPLLTSKDWWEETTLELRKLFAKDPGYHPSMFRRQLAVMKGQAWNIVQCLKHSDEGPLELTRRKKMLVWDDEIEIDDNATPEAFSGPLTSSPLIHNRDVPPPSPSPRPRPRRSLSIGNSDGFPPLVRRASTDITGLPRPVSFAHKFPRINPGASGVAVLEHMERLDAVEAGLKRLGEDTVFEEEGEDEDGDIGTSIVPPEAEPIARSPSTPPAVHTEEEEEADEGDITGQSIENLARSYPQFEAAPHFRTSSSQQPMHAFQTADWLREDVEGAGKRTVIIERLEPVKERSLFPC